MGPSFRFGWLCILVAACGGTGASHGGDAPDAADETRDAPEIAHGVLDEAFGSGGIATIHLSDADDRLGDVVVLPDGRLIATGSSGENVITAGFTASGELDPGFAGDGSRSADLGTTMDLGGRIVRTSAGNVAVSAIAAGSAPATSYVLVVTPEGGPASTFGSLGTVAVTVPSLAPLYATDLVARPNGGVVAVGFGAAGNANLCFLERISAMGTFDAASDITLLDPGGNDCTLQFAMSTPEGGLLVGGGAGADTLVARYLASGAPDTTFNSTGFRRFAADDNASLAVGAGIATDGSLRVLVAGENPIVVKLTPDGKIDSSFGVSGRVAVSTTAETTPWRMVMLPDDSMLVLGQMAPAGTSSLVVTRLRPDGSVDPAFGVGGHFVHELGAGATAYKAYATGLALVGTDRLLIAGATFTSAGDLDAVLVQLVL